MSFLTMAQHVLGMGEPVQPDNPIPVTPERARYKLKSACRSYTGKEWVNVPNETVISLTAEEGRALLALMDQQGATITRIETAPVSGLIVAVEEFLSGVRTRDGLFKAWRRACDAMTP